MKTSPEIYLEVIVCNSTKLSFAYQRTIDSGAIPRGDNFDKKSLLLSLVMEISPFFGSKVYRL